MAHLNINYHYLYHRHRAYNSTNNNGINHDSHPPPPPPPPRLSRATHRPPAHPVREQQQVCGETADNVTAQRNPVLSSSNFYRDPAAFSSTTAVNTPRNNFSSNSTSSQPSLSLHSQTPFFDSRGHPVREAEPPPKVDRDAGCTVHGYGDGEPGAYSDAGAGDGLKLALSSSVRLSSGTLSESAQFQDGGINNKINSRIFKDIETAAGFISEAQQTHPTNSSFFPTTSGTTNNNTQKDVMDEFTEAIARDLRARASMQHIPHRSGATVRESCRRPLAAPGMSYGYGYGHGHGNGTATATATATATMNATKPPRYHGSGSMGRTNTYAPNRPPQPPPPSLSYKLDSAAPAQTLAPNAPPGFSIPLRAAQSFNDSNASNDCLEHRPSHGHGHGRPPRHYGAVGRACHGQGSDKEHGRVRGHVNQDETALATVRTRTRTEFETPPQFNVSYSKYIPARAEADNDNENGNGNDALVPSSPRSISPRNITCGIMNGEDLSWSSSGSGSGSAGSSPSSKTASPTWSPCAFISSPSSCEGDGERGGGVNGGSNSKNGGLGPRLGLVERKERMIVSLTRILETTCRENDARLQVGGVAGCSKGYRSTLFPDGSNSLFFSMVKPAIGVKAYVARFVKYLPVCEAVFMVALVYLDRVRQREVVLGLTHLNVHRLLTCAITVAQKYLEDEPYGNGTMFKLGGIPSVQELNQLEVEFLKRIDCRVFTEPEVYEEYRSLVLP